MALLFSSPAFSLRLLTLLPWLMISGCATRDIESWSQSLEVVPVRVDSQPLALMTVRNHAFMALETDRVTDVKAGELPAVHVYIEGDGQAYLRPNLPSDDPTPNEPVALQLMANDPAPALWLARPCQYLRPVACTPALWTLERYGDATIESLHDAIKREVADDQPLILIGHSGGGTLAMLLAPRIKAVKAVVTVAGNINVGRWTQHHRYTPLTGSRDPARESSLPPTITQIHWVGGKDTNIPAQWAIESSQGTEGLVLLAPDAGHVCCWAQTWPDQLRIVQQLLNTTDRRH